MQRTTDLQSSSRLSHHSQQRHQKEAPRVTKHQSSLEYSQRRATVALLGCTSFRYITETPWNNLRSPAPCLPPEGSSPNHNFPSLLFPTAQNPLLSTLKHRIRLNTFSPNRHCIALTQVHPHAQQHEILNSLISQPPPCPRLIHARLPLTCSASPISKTGNQACACARPFQSVGLTFRPSTLKTWSVTMLPCLSLPALARMNASTAGSG